MNLRIVLIITIIILLLASAFYLFWPKPANPGLAMLGEEVPYIAQEGTHQRALHLPPQLEDALKAFDPHFRPFALDEFPKDVLKYYIFTDRATPSAVIADFNGDSVMDIALLGESQGKIRLLAFVSHVDENQHGFYEGLDVGHQLITSANQRPIQYFINFVEGSQTLPALFPGQSITDLHHDAIELGFPNGSTVIMYWKKNRFAEHWTVQQ